MKWRAEKVLWFSELGTVTNTDRTPKHLDSSKLGIPEETKRVKHRKEGTVCRTVGEVPWIQGTRELQLSLRPQSQASTLSGMNRGTQPHTQVRRNCFTYS